MSARYESLIVEPGLEGHACTGVHDDPHLGVGVELLPGTFELGQHRGVHGVAGLGAVEHQPTDVVLALDEEGLVLAHERGTSFHGAPS